MSNTKEKLNFILEKIEDILVYRDRFRSIEELLNDKMGFDATLMALLQIGETLNKLKNTSFSEKLPIKGSYDLRNFIAHDYEGVNKAIVEDVIRNHLLPLKKIVNNILSDIC